MVASPASFEVYRYSPRTVFAYGMMWLLGASGLTFCLTVTAVQYVRTSNTSVLLPTLFAAFITAWSGAAIAWLQNRPTLRVNEDGLLVSKFGRRKTFLRWAEIEKVEDFRRVALKTHRSQRSFLLHWHEYRVGFNEYYVGLPRLIAKINEEIQKHAVRVVVHDYNPATLSAALIAARSPDERNRMRTDGVVTTTNVLLQN